MMKIPNIVRSTLLATVFSVPIVMAEEIPEDMLLMDYTDCMQGCLDQAGNTACEILCGCSVNRFRAELDFEAYDLMIREMLKDEVSSENREFLDETGKICVAEMDRLMTEFALEEGLVEEAPADETSPAEEEEDEGENP